MNDIRSQARTAGVLYILVSFIAPIGLVYVPSKLYVRDNATETADRIRASEWLLRLGISSELVHEILWVFVVLALYRLFKPVNEYRAQLMLIVGALVSVPIVLVNVLNEIAAMLLVSGAHFLTPFTTEQLNALAFMYYRLHGQGLNVASVLWGLWLFPFALLVIRSGFVPKLLGWLLIPAGVGYVVSAFVTVLVPQYQGIVDSIAGLLEFGELPIIFWLLIWGAKSPTVQVEIAMPK